MRQELIAVPRELATQFLIVVDLAVAHELDRSVRAVQRLSAALEIDDRQATVPKRCVAVSIDALAIGAPVAKRFEHALEGGVARRVRADDAGDAAHAADRSVGRLAD